MSVLKESKNLRKLKKVQDWDIFDKHIPNHNGFNIKYGGLERSFCKCGKVYAKDDVGQCLCGKGQFYNFGRLGYYQGIERQFQNRPIFKEEQGILKVYNISLTSKESQDGESVVFEESHKLIFELAKDSVVRHGHYFRDVPLEEVKSNYKIGRAHV